MKGGFFILMIALLFTQCTKSTSPPDPTAPPASPTGPTGNPVTATGLPSKVTDYKPGAGISGQRVITEFSYDANGWPAVIRMHSFDTSGTIPYTDSFRIDFQPTGGDNPPKSYDITWMVGTAPPAFGATEHHLLYYDNQNRIIKDSTNTTNWLDLAANKFTYSANRIFVDRFDYSSQFPNASVTPYTSDTLTLTNANITAYSSYYLGGGGSDLVETDTYTTSKSVNPLYQAKIANSLGAMLRFTYIGFSYIGDFISPSLMDRWTYQYRVSIPPWGLNYTWTTDASGKVVLGTGMDPTNGIGISEIYTFDY